MSLVFGGRHRYFARLRVALGRPLVAVVRKSPVDDAAQVVGADWYSFYRYDDRAEYKTKFHLNTIFVA